MLEFFSFLGKLFYEFYMTFNIKFLDMPIGFIDFIISAFILGLIFRYFNVRERDDV